MPAVIPGLAAYISHRRAAEQAGSSSALLPAKLADQRHEADLGDALVGEFALAEAANPAQLLDILGGPHRDHQTAPDFELAFETLGDRRSTGGHQNGVER